MRRVRKLGKDDDLPPRECLVFLQMGDKCLELVVFFGSDLADDFQEHGQLVEIVVGVVDNLVEFVEVRVDPLDGSNFLVGEEILFVVPAPPVPARSRPGARGRS